tara:strand:- start:7030 stop:7944 length:915 start_codon:yes stop_codon:yes gene_type:complete
LKKKILIISGGFSKEREISLQTGEQVAKELKKNGYKIKICEPDHKLESIITKYKPKIIFNALHGQYGEDGYIQSVLEYIGIPYTHSGVIASSKAMDKEISKKIFIKHNILTPKFIKYSYDEPLSKIKKKIKKNIGFPAVVKPINEGSSVNVYISKESNLKIYLKKLRDYKEILIEQFIPGREIQAAILGNKKLGAIELKPKRMFYDYKAKYDLKAKTKHVIPVDLTKKNFDKIMNISLKAHNLLGCRGVTRSDFKFYKNKFYLLEINTQPGMTKLSLVPEISNYKGIKFIKLIELILEDASKNK